MDLSGRCHETDLTRWLRSPVSVRSPTGNRAYGIDYSIAMFGSPRLTVEKKKTFLKRNAVHCHH